MKLFKNSLLLIALFAIGSVCARTTSSRQKSAQVSASEKDRQTMRSTATRPTSAARSNAQARRGVKTTAPVQANKEDEYTRFINTFKNAEKAYQANNTKTYAKFLNEVKNAKKAYDGWERRLSPAFVEKLVQDARAAGSDDVELRALLNAARDWHVIFEGKNDADLELLSAINAQIEAAIATNPLDGAL